ncbi:cytoplasmic dynein 1 intermediate chain-like [Episyrphus balteatus]|uniref:cytoplasmic dynein 1 intermediate chain-like n=1 Tax=Episyrphus balteatus TaxID=286459 RepID=UPI0024858A99|nr:cytoplasmic dynein 1 intermediate chain-like [Episyrphus balteatus]
MKRRKRMIILSEDFERLVLRAGRVIERALSKNVDIYIDYIGGVGDYEESNDERTHARLSLNRAFYEDRWSKNRCITSMD